MDFADFIYEPEFLDDWKSFGLSIEQDLWDLEVAIAAVPKTGNVIPGSGGLRKLRWGRQGIGKRGGVRIIYLWIPEIVVGYMVLVYAKSEADDLSRTVVREIKVQAEIVRKALLKFYGVEV